MSQIDARPTRPTVPRPIHTRMGELRGASLALGCDFFGGRRLRAAIVISAVVLIQPGLEDHARGRLVDTSFRFFPMNLAGGERAACLNCRQALVPQLDVASGSVRDGLGELAGAPGGVPFPALHV